jgi:hypothetical protein
MNIVANIHARYPNLIRLGWLAVVLLLAACNNGSGGSGGGGY